MSVRIGFVALTFACISASAYAVQSEWDWSARARVAALEQGSDTGRAGSLLVRGQVDSNWAETLTTFAQVDAVASVWQNHHSDGERLNGEPFLPDVPGADLNQVWLGYHDNRWRLRLGRQRIALDDQRFVGGNGFWQNEQTFDALRLERRLGSASRMEYAYIGNVNRIQGERADLPHPVHLLGDHRHKTHLLHWRLNEWDAVKADAYHYRIDNRDLPASSNYTTGGKLTYSGVAAGLKHQWIAAFATQSRPAIPTSPRPQYQLLEVSLVRGPWRGVGRYERLGADRGVAFATPLASGHDFQGSADAFTDLPAAGLLDTSVTAQWRFSPWRLEVRAHDFREANGHDEAVGREMDMEIAYTLARDHEFALRAADFQSADESRRDVRRLILDYAFRF